MEISDSIVDTVHETVKAICEKKGYKVTLNKLSVRLVLEALLLTKQAMDELDRRQDEPK